MTQKRGAKSKGKAIKMKVSAAKKEIAAKAKNTEKGAKAEKVDKAEIMEIMKKAAEAAENQELPEDLLGPEHRLDSLIRMAEQRLCYRTKDRGVQPPYDALSPELNHYLQYLRILWEEPENAYDSEDPPYMAVTINYDQGHPGLLLKHGLVKGPWPGARVGTLHLFGMHRERSPDLEELLAQLPEKCPKLEYFRIEDQFLAEIPDWFFKLQKLRSIGLFLPNLERLLPNFFKNFPELRSLRLYCPKLTELPDQFDNCPNLRGIDLYATPHIKRLPPTLVDAPDLIGIEIYGYTELRLKYSQFHKLMRKKVRFTYCNKIDLHYVRELWRIPDRTFSFYYIDYVKEFYPLETYLRLFNHAHGCPAPGRPANPQLDPKREDIGDGVNEEEDKLPPELRSENFDPAREPEFPLLELLFDAFPHSGWRYDLLFQTVAYQYLLDPLNPVPPAEKIDAEMRELYRRLLQSRPQRFVADKKQYYDFFQITPYP